MHLVISNFKIPDDVDRQDLIEKFTQSAPVYRDLEGLIHKYYLLGDGHDNVGGDKAGGVYVFKDRAAADAWFTPDKIAWAEERFGKVTLLHFDVPIDLSTTPPQINTHHD